MATLLMLLLENASLTDNKFLKRCLLNTPIMRNKKRQSIMGIGYAPNVLLCPLRKFIVAQKLNNHC